MLSYFSKIHRLSKLFRLTKKGQLKFSEWSVIVNLRRKNLAKTSKHQEGKIQGKFNTITKRLMDTILTLNINKFSNNKSSQIKDITLKIQLNFKITINNLNILDNRARYMTHYLRLTMFHNKIKI